MTTGFAILTWLTYLWPPILGLSIALFFRRTLPLLLGVLLMTMLICGIRGLLQIPADVAGYIWPR